MSSEREIIIVSGLPRSGTSLMMQMLQSGGLEILTDHERVADDDNPRGYLEFERVKKIQHDKTWLPEARGKAVKMISQLLYELPPTEHYRIIFMNRDLDEVIASQEKMLIRRGMTVPDRTLIRNAFDSHVRKLLDWLPKQPCRSVLHVDYADLITRPGHWTSLLTSFLGKPLNTEAMLSAVDPTLYRNRIT